MLIGIGKNPFRIIEEHIVIKGLGAVCGQLKTLCATCSGHDRVGGCHGRYDVLDDTLSKTVGDSNDT